MELFLQRTLTTTLLLLLCFLHPVHLQNTEADVDTTVTPTEETKNPVPVPHSWLRGRPKPMVIQPNDNDDDGTATHGSNALKPLESEDPWTDVNNDLQEDNEDPPADDPPPSESGDPTRDGSSTDDQSGNGVASGSMYYVDPTEDPTEPSIFQNETILESENKDFNVSSTTLSPDVNTSMTDADAPTNDTLLERVEEEIPQNSTSSANVTEVESVTPAPETNATQPGDAGSGEGFTVLTNATTAAPSPETTHRPSTSGPTVLIEETTEPESEEEDELGTTEEPTEPEETTAEPPETTEITTSVPAITERANLSDKGAAASGGTAERGFGSESERRQRKSAWGAVLGTFVAIAVVGLVAYVILKKKHQKAFNHRKLEEDFPSDPVLRLDNSEPLDLNFGRAAYYNPGLQGDNIQMSPYPKN